MNIGISLAEGSTHSKTAHSARINHRNSFQRRIIKKKNGLLLEQHRIKPLPILVSIYSKKTLQIILCTVSDFFLVLICSDMFVKDIMYLFRTKES